MIYKNDIKLHIFWLFGTAISTCYWPNYIQGKMKL